MWSRLQESSSMNLGWFSKLECKHVFRNTDPDFISKSISRIKPSSLDREFDRLTFLICIESWGKRS